MSPLIQVGEADALVVVDEVLVEEELIVVELLVVEIVLVLGDIVEVVGEVLDEVDSAIRAVVLVETPLGELVAIELELEPVIGLLVCTIVVVVVMGATEETVVGTGVVVDPAGAGWSETASRLTPRSEVAE